MEIETESSGAYRVLERKGVEQTEKAVPHDDRIHLRGHWLTEPQ
jgi:hypothetical protein